MRDEQRDTARNDGASHLEPDPMSKEETLDFLRRGEIIDCKLVPWGSNYTFAVVLRNAADSTLISIYKPRAGEAPLWDFPSGTLYQREYAAYLVSQRLGWEFIPHTVIRDGPHGVGTVQLYVDPDDESHYFNFRGQHQDELMRMTVFDLVANNADRKAGHAFRGREDGRLWGIDHGLTFHVNPKLRTVLWDFCGEPVDPRLTRALRRIERRQEMLLALLQPYLSIDEILMVMVRVERVLQTGTFPMLNPRRNIPYGW
jgi:hypothetical protein